MSIDVTLEQQKQMWSYCSVRLYLLQGNILPHEGVVADSGFELLFSGESLCSKESISGSLMCKPMRVEMLAVAGLPTHCLHPLFALGKPKVSPGKPIFEKH